MAILNHGQASNLTSFFFLKKKNHARDTTLMMAWYDGVGRAIQPNHVFSDAKLSAIKKCFSLAHFQHVGALFLP